MKSPDAIYSSILDRIGRLYQMPWAHCRDADSLDEHLEQYHSLWAFVVDAEPLLRQAYQATWPHAAGFAAHYRRRHRSAREGAAAQFVVEHWQQVDSRLGFALLTMPGVPPPDWGLPAPAELDQGPDPSSGRRPRSRSSSQPAAQPEPAAPTHPAPQIPVRSPDEVIVRILDRIRLTYSLLEIPSRTWAPMVEDEILYSLHELWAEILDLEPQLRLARNHLWGNTLGFSAFFRRSYPHASETEAARFVLDQWKRMDFAVGLVVPSEPS